jgi:hypothetical protein
MRTLAVFTIGTGILLVVGNAHTLLPHEKLLLIYMARFSFASIDYSSTHTPNTLDRSLPS